MLFDSSATVLSKDRLCSLEAVGNIVYSSAVVPSVCRRQTMNTARRLKGQAKATPDNCPLLGGLENLSDEGTVLT